MSHPLRVLTCLFLVLGVFGCGDGDPAGRSELVELDDPVLDRVEPAVRGDLERSLADLRSLARMPDVSDETLGESYGDLGRLYHAYRILDSALPCYRNASALLPDDYRWPYYLGQVYRVLEEPEQAQAALERVLELKPRDEPTLVTLAELHRKAASFDEAARLAEEVLSQNTNSAGALLLMGRLAMDRGDFAGAVAWYERLLHNQPQATNLYHPLALAYRNLGRMDKAEEYVKAHGEGKVSVSDPLMEQLKNLQAGSKAQLNRGSTAFSAGDFEAAEQAFRKAVEVNPEDVSARLNLGSALVRLGRFEEAVEQYRLALERDPDHAMTHFNLGIVLARLGNQAESIRHYEEAIRIDPTYPDPRFNLANALRRGGRCDLALGHYERLNEMDPGRGPARVGEAICLMKTGRFEEAMRGLEEGLQVLRDDRLLRLTTAKLLAACPDARIRDANRALDLARRLVEERRSPESLEAMAMALAEAGRFDESVRAQQEAVTLAAPTRRARLIERLDRNLEKYQRQEPCRDPVD